MADSLAHPGLPRNAPSEPRAGILLVDDNPANLLALRAILEELDQNLVDAPSGEEALQRAQSDEFAVVLLDMLMPGLSGFETATRIRSQNRSQHTPIIFLTANDIERSQLEEAYALGAVDFLVKPLQPIILRAKVRGFVDLFQDKQRAKHEANQLRLLVHGTTEYAIFMLDPEGCVITWNAGAERLKGYSQKEIVGQHFSRFYPQNDIDRGWPAHELQVARAEGRFEDEGWRVRKDGSQFWANVVITALRDEAGNFVGFSKITKDLTERKRSEESARRLLEEAAARRVAEESAGLIREQQERLHVTLTERKRAERLLACQNRALEMVAEGSPLAATLEYLVRTIEAESTTGVIAAIHLLDQTGSHFRQAIAPSLPEAYREATAVAVASGLGPCCRAVSSREPVSIADVASDPKWARYAELARSLDIRACWSTPILSSEGKVLGTFANHYRNPGDPSPQDRQLVEIVTRTAALAIERVGAGDALRESERVARFLADASAALAVLVDFDSTLQKVASLAVPSFADWATVDLVEDDGTLRRVAVAHADPDKVELAHELHRRFPPDPAAPLGVRNILRTGRAEILPEITDDLFARSVQNEELLRILRELGLKSYVGVPLKVRGKTLGVVTFIAAESGRHYDEADLATAQDLADRAAIAIENAQLYRELRDADRRKDEFLATLAHELRNPLAPIRNGLQILRLSGMENGMVADARAMMERQLSQMVRLVDDLLDVSRITRNKLDLRKQRVTLAAVVHSAVETSRPLIEQSRHTLSLTLPPGPVHIDADPVRLAQVFSNLLNNSAKYTEPGGRIWLTAEVSGHEVAVRVRDTGLGIPADALPRIFEMFSQVDRNMERAQGGLGIGLTLVRRLVEMHDGKVEARSDGPGRGSEFTVRLPLAAEDAVARPLPPDDGPTATSNRRILIVDDNRDSAMSLGMMLGLMGNETRTAHDGLAAVEAAAEFRPDLILLDIGLPKLNGYDACRRIRKQPWSAGMVIVALTGWG